MGKTIIKNICAIVEPMGREMAALSPIKCWRMKLAKKGIVKIVMMLLKAVKVTESATSPLAK
jgi:hypothetical protein